MSMNLRYILTIFSICFAQVSIDSTPKSFNLEDNLVIPTESLPSFNIDQFLEQDEQDMRN